MKMLEYYAGLRADLLEVLQGVKNAGTFLWWDDTSPNWLTKQKLEKIFRKYVGLAKPFGLHLIRSHNECGNKRHRSVGVGGNYVIESDEFPRNWSDPNYVTGAHTFEGYHKCKCPCSKNNEPTEHYVIEKLVYFASEQHLKIISMVLADIYSAIENAEDRKPRSGIREYVLRAVMRLNEAILPISVGEYLNQQRLGQ